MGSESEPNVIPGLEPLFLMDRVWFRLTLVSFEVGVDTLYLLPSLPTILTNNIQRVCEVEHSIGKLRRRAGG